MGSCSGRSMSHAVVDSNPKANSDSLPLTITAQTFIKASPQKLIDVYKIGKSLGTGAFGEVRIVTHKESGREMAVKIFRKMKYPSKKAMQKLRNEIEILKRLDHPNIIRIFEYFEDEKKLYIIMEKCEGGELYSQILKNSSLSERETIMITKQLVSAVAYLHEMKIVHRDIKPENILFETRDDFRSIKLIDFGVAEEYYDHQALSETVGTLFYIAPEVLLEDYDQRCDLWSCGVIVYMLLCGSPPFNGNNDYEVISNIKKLAFSFDGAAWQQHSDEAKDFVRKLLVAKEDRMSAIEALAHVWLNVDDNSPAHSEICVAALEALRNFHRSNKLKEAVRTYITSQVLSIRDTKELKRIFTEIDANGDGRLSREELMQFYSKIMGLDYTEEEIDAIIKEVDSDKNGFVDYSEFIKATISDQVISNENNLKIAFRKFDIDNSGKISAAELKKVLQVTQADDDAIWREIIKLADFNHDGEIDFKEFADLVLKS